jgi:hypothetical protein
VPYDAMRDFATFGRRDVKFDGDVVRNLTEAAKRADPLTWRRCRDRCQFPAPAPRISFIVDA